MFKIEHNKSAKIVNEEAYKDLIYDTKWHNVSMLKNTLV